MKKLILISAGFLLVLAGCFEEDALLKQAENQIRKYLDYPGSYRRVEWRITDTIFRNEMMLESLKEPLSIEQEKLEALTRNAPELETKLKSKREDLAKCVNGKWVYPAPAQPTATAWQKPVMITVPEEEIRSQLNDMITDSANLADAISRISFRKDSIENLIADLQKGVRGSEISQIRMEIRFRARMNNNQTYTFMTKMMYLKKLNEFEVLDTYYDGLKVREKSE
jgi:hypothetical protein